MNSWNMRSLDRDELLLVRICLKQKFLSPEQVQDILSQSVGKQFIFVLLDSGQLSPENLIEALRLRERSLLCPNCDTLQFVEESENRIEGHRCSKCEALLPVHGSEELTGATQRHSYGKYEILGELGSGSMGVVYRAFQRDLDRHVALKVLRAEDTTMQSLLRFKQEAKAIAALNHPYIVSIYEIGEERGEYYIAMEYIEGRLLSEAIQEKTITWQRATELGIYLALAIAHAHSKGVIHRDLKPDNIIITPEGLPKVTDFGLARQMTCDVRVTEGNMIMGTPAYMSPEQASGDTNKIGQASDIYALGAVLYEMLCGQPPFNHPSTYVVLQHIISLTPSPPSSINPAIPHRLEKLCLKAMSKKIEDRFSSAKAMAQELEDFLDKEKNPSMTGPSSSPLPVAVHPSPSPVVAKIGERKPLETPVKGVQRSAVIPGMEKIAASTKEGEKKASEKIMVKSQPAADDELAETDSSPKPQTSPTSQTPRAIPKNPYLSNWEEKSESSSPEEESLLWDTVLWALVLIALYVLLRYVVAV